MDLFILTFTPEVVLRYLQRVQSLAPLGYGAGGEIGMGTVPFKNISFTENFVNGRKETLRKYNTGEISSKTNTWPISNTVPCNKDNLKF